MPDGFRRHSATAQAAYHDLLSLLLDETVSEIRGTPTRRERGGRSYWYERYRIGSSVKERYLGEDSDVLRARFGSLERLKGEREGRRRERARLVRLLRSERFVGMEGATGSLLAAFARAGVFRLGGVLVGTNAFRIYEGELGLRLGLDQTAMTSDIDIASFERLSLALGETVLPTISELLAEFAFSPVPGLGSERTWRWRQAGGEAVVEFLTPSFEEEEGVRDLAALGVSARALHHLNYLIADPIPAAAVWRNGVLVVVPRPERFAIHKLIVADRRREGPDSLKARKDLLQAGLLIAVLAEDRPDDLALAHEDAARRGPRWRERIARSLARAPAAAALLRACTA
ncbi:nucleotidyltransferase family protein [Marinimicrococcus flavescens]|uniref:GSU2403 family nucleotidyltransferase fold protein n=1 Tax=Marinimicrococcus flavescens TaxID=3031815 RepID=A0AAP3UYP3_9PROT|nr:GSU2403 family nucleotidyltransferase fold protein [Marinimicrococcus flavescens]